MFFGVSGSIAGGTMFTPPFIPAGHVGGDVEQRRRRSPGWTGSSCSIVSGFGVETSMWQRQTQRTRLLRRELVDRRRLRVVHDADVPPARELARVHLVVPPPDRPLLLAEVLRVALERVVHELGGGEELVRP